MLDAPNLIDRQRAILRRFRVAYQTRRTTEACATARRQTDLQITDTALMQITKTAEQRRDQLVSQAGRRLKATINEAESSHVSLVKRASISLAKVRDAGGGAKHMLSEVGYLDLAVATPIHTPPTQTPGEKFSAIIALEVATKAALAYNHRLQAATEALKACRAATVRRTRVNTARRLTAWLISLVAIVGLIAVQKIMSLTTEQTATWFLAIAALITVLVGTRFRLRFWQADHVTATSRPITPMALSTVETDMPANLWPLYSRYGFQFVRVPEAEFVMGSDKSYRNFDEQPVHNLKLGEYWIGLTEVTNAQYRSFVNAGGYNDASLWTESGWQWRTDNDIAEPGCWGNPSYNAPEQPVICVSWYEAMAYVSWLSRETGLNIRLPTEAEWEKAARGTDSRQFPWGEEWPKEPHANFNWNISKSGADFDWDWAKPSAVGSYPAGASPFGALDMAGNVFEWTSSFYADYPYTADDGREVTTGVHSRVVRGGAWCEHDTYLRTTYRGAFSADERNDILGLRVVVVP